MTGTLKRTPEQMPDAAGPPPAGLAPVAEPRFAHLLAEADAQRPPLPFAADTFARSSHANQCARRISFVAHGVEESNPPDLASHANFALGTWAHEQLQSLLVDLYGDDVDIEPKWQIGDLVSGHTDAVLHDPGGIEVIEIKTIGGYGFKLATTDFRGPPEGPKDDHLVQLALNVVGNDADVGTLVYISKENANLKSIATVYGKFCAEWTLTREQLQPLADKELARLAAIRDLVTDGKLAPAHIPGLMPSGARVVDATSGLWKLVDGDLEVDTGSAWSCGYCGHQDVCATYADRGTPEVGA